MINIAKYKVAFKNFSMYFSASLIPMALSLAANPFIAMNLSPEDYAITGYFTSFTSLITPLISFYFLQYYIKRYFEQSEDCRRELKAALYRLLIIYSFFASLLCFAGVYGYIRIFNSNMHFKIFPYLPLAILCLPLTGIASLELADFKMEKKTKEYFCMSVIIGIANTVALLLFVVALKMGATGKLLAPFLINLIVFLYLLVRHRQLWSIKINRQYYYSIFKFCWPLAGAAMLGYFTNGFDKTYLESIGNTTEYGYYCVGAGMAVYLTVFSAAVSNTFQPDIYEAIAKNDNRKLFRTFGAQVGAIAIFVLLFIACCPLIVYILTAGCYMPAVPYTRIISISTLTSVLYYNINCVTIAKGFPRISLYTSIIGSVMVVLLMPTAAEKWQYIGGAWMNVTSYILFLLVNAILLCLAYRLKKSNIFFGK